MDDALHRGMGFIANRVDKFVRRRGEFCKLGHKLARDGIAGIGRVHEIGDGRRHRDCIALGHGIKRRALRFTDQSGSARSDALRIVRRSRMAGAGDVMRTTDITRP